MDTNKQTVSTFGKGALYEDPEKFALTDYSHKENPNAFKAAPITWVEKNPQQFVTYGPVRDQNTSSACTCYTNAVILGVENLREEGKFVVLSPRAAYASIRYSDGGCFPRDAFGYCGDNGLPFEVQVPSDGKDEASMAVSSDVQRSDVLVAHIFRGGPYFSIPVLNQTTDQITNNLASVIDRGKAVGIAVAWDGDLNPDGGNFKKDGGERHEITIVDRTLWHGKRAFVYQNSWGKQWGYGGHGVITEDQLTTGGVDSLLYFESFKNQGQGDNQKPKYVFTKHNRLGSHNTDVAMLQRCLGYVSDSYGTLFPLTESPTGYFGGLTQASLKRFQALSGIPQTGETDTATLQALTNYFS